MFNVGRTRTLLHCVCGKVTQETLDAAYFGGRILTYKLDTTGTGTLGRTVGYQLGVSGSPGLEADITYGYDALDRFNSLSMLGGPAYTYSYTSNSNLIASITDTASGWTETMAYNSTRDLLDSVDGQFSTAHKATFAYAYDTLGRRTSLVSSGEIFDRYSGAGLHNLYSYDDRSEVTGATGYTGQNVSDTSTASKLGGRDFGYSYDPIGNRVSSSVDGGATSYAANALNQYMSRTAPGSTWVTGLAPASATVTVNSVTAARWGDYYALSVAAGSRPLWQSFAVSSSLGGSVTRTGYVAPSPENFSYDLDGNLTDDGRWHYTWDAENRLTSMETSSVAYGAGAPRQLLSFKYDYLGRRVRKTVANWNGSAYVATVDRKFIYDGWNLVAEYDALTSFILVRSYLWGLDLSRTLQDGGGVGGLLAVVDVSSGVVHQPFFDGNGNVHALVNRATGAVTAAYEFSAFGETLRATGSFAQGNPFRFSSKYTDDESGLLYYGRRYYDPKNGRFLGRDPIEEKGGLHLYAFCANNGINRWDLLGMKEVIEGMAPFVVSASDLSWLNGFGDFFAGGDRGVSTGEVDFGGGGGSGGGSKKPPEKTEEEKKKELCDKLKAQQDSANKAIESTSNRLTQNLGVKSEDLWQTVQNINTWSGVATGAISVADFLQGMRPPSSIPGRYGPISNGGLRGSALPPAYNSFGFGVAVFGVGVDGANTVINWSNGQTSAAVQSGSSAALGAWGLFFPPAALASAGGALLVFGIDTVGGHIVDGIDRKGIAEQTATDLKTYQNAFKQYKGVGAQITKNGCN